MRNSRCGLACAAAMLISESLMAAPCELPSPLLYPMEEVVKSKGIALSVAAMSTDMSDFLSNTVPSGAATEALLEPLSPTERDIWLLGGLHWDTQGSIPLLGLYVFNHQAPRLSFYLDALDRSGLDKHAAILRAGGTAFDPHRKTPKARYDQWSDGKGGILDKALDSKMRSLSGEFLALPSVLTTATEILNEDADLAARFEQERLGADDYAKHQFLMGRLHECLDADTVEASIKQLPQPNADMILADWFNLEMLNGGVHQFFNNSTGDYAPQVAEALDRMDLPKHAQAVRDGMEMYPQPYPTDRTRRLSVMNEFSDAQGEALNDLTGTVDDGLIFDGIKQTAERAGIWPQ